MNKIISIETLTEFRKELALENKTRDIYDFLPNPFRWIEGVLSYDIGSVVQACSNRMFKLKKGVVVVTNNIEDYDLSFHCYSNSNQLLYNTGWITIKNNSVLSYDYFKSLSENTDFFTIMAKRKDNNQMSLEDFKDNIGVYYDEKQKLTINYNIYTGVTLTDGVPEDNQYRAMSEPIIFDDSIVINVGLIGSASECLRLNFNCFDENGKYLGKTGYFAGYNRSITGYDIKAISQINSKIKYVIMLVRNYGGTQLDYNELKSNLSIYVSKETQIKNKQQDYAPYKLISPYKRNAFVYSINSIGKSISSGYRSQGLACHNGKVFIANYKYDYSENTKILVCGDGILNPTYSNTLIDLGSAIHAPSMNFGEKQNENDDFPLLYITVGERTIGNLDNSCEVYSLVAENNSYSVSLVRTINIGFTNDSDLWGNSTEQIKYAVSVENNLLILFKANGTQSNRVFVFSLPNTDKVLQTTDIIYYFDIPYTDLCQDICVKDNLLYVVAGRPETDIINQYNRVLRVVDIFEKREIGRLNFKHIKNNENNILTTFSELEGIDFIHENRLLISQTDYNVLFVVDIRNPNIGSDFGD